MKKVIDVVIDIVGIVFAIIGGLLTPLLIILAIMGFGDDLVKGYKKYSKRR
jgi:hypothetical protein